MKTSYTTIAITSVLVSSSSYTTAKTYNGNTLDQCFPSNLPWFSFEGDDYIFSRERYNSICVDSDNREYQSGKIEGFWPPIDEPNSGCSKACVSGYGRGEARGCTSMKPDKLVGFNYNCEEAACYCLYERNTWMDDNSPCFDSMDIYNNGKGDVASTEVQQGSTCYSLHVQPSPTPSPTPRPRRGRSICTRSPDYKCYKTGRPACCSNPEYTCPDFMTVCDNHGEGTTGTSYCTNAPQYGCDSSTWSSGGWPLCCNQPGGDVMNCPKQQPRCKPESSNYLRATWQ